MLRTRKRRFTYAEVLRDLLKHARETAQKARSEDKEIFDNIELFLLRRLEKEQLSR